MRDKASARRRTLLILFLLVIFGALAVGYVLTFQLDTVRRVVQQHMLDAFGRNLHVGDIHVAFFPYPTLTLTNLQILESEQGKPFFQAARVRMNLSLLSIIQDEFVPKSLVIDDPAVYFRRDEQGQWNAESVLQGRQAGSVALGGFLADYTLTIENGVIQIVDAFEKAEPQEFELNNVALYLSNLSATKPMDVAFSANLDHDRGSQLSLQGTIDRVDQFFVAPQEAKESSGPTVTVRTEVELKQSDLLRVAKLLRLQDVPTLPIGRLKAQGQIRYASGMQGYDLVMSDIVVLSNVVDLQGQLSISGLMAAGPPTISATWASTPIRIKELLAMVPARLVPDEFRPAFDTLPFDGALEVVSATVSGSSREDVGFSFIGELKLSEGYLDLGKRWGAVEQVQGTVLIQADRVQLKDFTGLYDDSIPVSSGVGEIEFRDGGPWLSTELQGRVPSKKLLEIVRTVFGWNDPDHAMAGLVGEGGDGNMMIRLAGPLNQPEHIVLEDARYDAEHARIRVPGIEGPITNVSGTVTFSQSHVGFEPLKGILGSSPIALQGAIRFQDSEVFDALRLTGRLSTKDLAAQAGGMSASIRSLVSGEADMDAVISGSLDRPRIQTRWDLEKLEMSLGELLHKNKDVNGTLDAELELESGRRWKIHRMTLSLPPLSLSGQGVVDRNMKGAFSASVAVSSFDVASLPAGLTLFNGLLQKGDIECSLNMNGKGSDWRQWNKDGWLALTKGSLAVDGLNSPLSNVLLRVQLTRHTAEVKPLQFRMQESHARIIGTIQNWETQPQVAFQMTAPQFDIDLLIPKGERSPIREFLESVAATQTVLGTVAFRRAWYKDLNFQDIRGRLRIKNGIVGMDQIKGQAESGKIQGRVLIHLPVGQPAAVKTWVHIEDVPLQPLEATFLSEERLDEHLVTGTLSAQGMLQGHGRDARGIFPTLNGELNVLVKDGRIRRGTIIPKMLALMNLPAILQGKVDLNKDGYPFDKQSGTITIKNGIMSSHDIIMDGPILKLTGAGTYDLVDDQLDLVVAASPLGSYFKLLRKISLFRLLLEGDQESIDMALFEVKGPISDPVIKPLPLESFKTGLTGFAKLAFNVLKNTITLPKNILFPKNPPDAASSSNDQTDEGEDF